MSRDGSRELTSAVGDTHERFVLIVDRRTTVTFGSRRF